VAPRRLRIGVDIFKWMTVCLHSSIARSPVPWPSASSVWFWWSQRWFSSPFTR